jgi:hypothetical protein
MMNKWDTIQADVADAYVHLDEEQVREELDLSEELTDEQVDTLLAEMAWIA